MMKRILFLVGFFAMTTQAHGAIALSTNTACSGGACTTPGVTTTGATLLIVGESCSTTCLAPTDSLSNKWVALTQQTIGAVRESIWYSTNPVVGSAQTFTGSSPTFGICVTAFSGVLTSLSALDVQNGATTASTTSLQPGSITPSQNNELVVSYLGGGVSTNSPLINSGMTITNSMNFVASASYMQAMAYIVQTTASAINPIWTWTVSGSPGASIGAWKETPVVAQPNSVFTIR